MRPTDDGIFWGWFRETVLRELLAGGRLSDAVLDHLDQQVADLGLSWELGPAPDGSDD